jgi:hypothetical protein
MAIDPSDNCIDRQPELAAYALGEPPTPELEAHLRACRRCRDDLRAYAQLARALPATAPDAAPPPELRARVIAAVERAAAPVAPPHPPRRPWLALPALGFAVAAALLLAWALALQQQVRAQAAQLAASREGWTAMIALLNSGDVRWYPLQGDVASGHFWASPSQNVGCLVAQGLPPLPEGQAYQVWLLRGDERASGGVFQLRDGEGWAIVRADEPLTAYQRVEVTAGPAAGSAAPTGPPVLSGELERQG